MSPRFLQRSQAVLWPRYRRHRSERAQRSNADEHYVFEESEIATYNGG